MKYIAHRGLLEGPDSGLENHPHQIEKALQQGFDAEVDLWVVDSQLLLGHDAPQYFTDIEFLSKPGLWIHAKNLTALEYLNAIPHALNYFWHESDQFTLTSRGYIWTYPGKELTKRSVMVMPETVDSTLGICKNAECYAICSDYVLSISQS